MASLPSPFFGENSPPSHVTPSLILLGKLFALCSLFPISWLHRFANFAVTLWNFAREWLSFRQVVFQNSLCSFVTSPNSFRDLNKGPKLPQSLRRLNLGPSVHLPFSHGIGMFFSLLLCLAYAMNLIILLSSRPYGLNYLYIYFFLIFNYYYYFGVLELY